MNILDVAATLVSSDFGCKCRFISVFYIQYVILTPKPFKHRVTMTSHLLNCLLPD